MPVILLERMPLPRLRTYTAFSVILFASAVYYAHYEASVIHEETETTTDDPNADVQNDNVYYVHDRKYELLRMEHMESQAPELNLTDALLQSVGQNMSDVDSFSVRFASVILGETWCIWSVVNMACCCLILIGRSIQKLVFGDLRVSEQQHLRDKFWNFAFYKFIFIFGVMNVQSMEEVVLWCTWFGVLACLHLLTQLCKDRFEYLAFSPSTPLHVHVKVVMLLLGILGCCAGLFALCILVGYMFVGFNIFLFMMAEVILLMIKTSYVVFKYGIHLYDVHHDRVWENRTVYSYYTELVFELVAISIDFCNHVHMLIWSNIFLSMASLVICMQLRYLFHELQTRIKRHKNYLRVVNTMDEKLPMATAEELDEANTDCAICWEKMEHARKLPCGHFFHNACLRSWLEQDTSCPICRNSLGDLQRPRPPTAAPTMAGDTHPHPPPSPNVNIPQPPGIGANFMTNHFFHFDGSRYVSWLPSFSVEVSHTQLMGHRLAAAHMQTSQLDNMARQVQEVFPDMPLPTILTDLQITRSIEQTIENIVEGRVQQPPSFSRSSAHDSDSDSSSGLDQDSGSRSSDPDTFAGSRPDLGQPASSVAPGELYDGLRLPPPVSLRFAAEPETRDNLELHVNSEASESHEQTEDTRISGGRFSKSPTERQAMLGSRRQVLLGQARRRFLARQSSGDPTNPEPTYPEPSYPESSYREPNPMYDMSQLLEMSAQNEENDSRLRRERAYLAAQRRLHHD